MVLERLTENRCDKKGYGSKTKNTFVIPDAGNNKIC